VTTPTRTSRTIGFILHPLFSDDGAQIGDDSRKDGETEILHYLLPPFMRTFMMIHQSSPKGPGAMGDGGMIISMSSLVANLRWTRVRESFVPSQ
jgi:hypothetical protein